MQSEGRPLYQDAEYLDSVRRGLTRVNIDLCTNFTLKDLDEKLSYLVELAATIDFAKIRGAEGASADVSDVPDAGVQMLNIPGLMIQKIPPILQGTTFWKDLWESLTDEYESSLSSCSDQYGGGQIIQVGTQTRTSLRTGRKSLRIFSRALPAVTVVATVDGQDVTLSWDVVRDTHFGYYKIFRADNVAMTGAEKISTQGDGLHTTFTDTPGVGAWYYRVDVINDHEQESPSLPVTATVV